jgi:hypothetical protein
MLSGPEEALTSRFEATDCMWGGVGCANRDTCEGPSDVSIVGVVGMNSPYGLWRE